MGNFGYTFFLLVAIAVAVFGIVRCVQRHIKSKETPLALTTMQALTFYCFWFAFILFMPASIKEFGCNGIGLLIRMLFATVHSTLAAFVVDGDIGSLIRDLPDLAGNLHFWYSFMLTVACVAAPVMTLANVLVLFKNVINVWRSNMKRRTRPVYVMSELNEQSLAVALSIHETLLNNNGKDWEEELKRFDEKRPKWLKWIKIPEWIHSMRTVRWLLVRPVFVFTDVFGKCEESHYELVLEARKVGAILVKTDVLRLKLCQDKVRVEVFLIGENESENVAQAIALTNMYNGRKNFAIFVYASGEGSGHIIDSLNKGQYLLGDEIQTNIANDPKGVLDGKYDEMFKTGVCSKNTFYIKRVNPIEMLVTDMLKGLAPEVMAKAEETGIVSLTIVGMGLYGKQILKTSVWFFQKLGYKLEINVFDDTTKAYDEIGQECPELISKNPSMAYGDACYDIKFFSKVNCFTSAFDKCFEGEDKERLKRTQAVFVTLGNDDMNIEASIMIRKLFDRVNGITKNAFKRDEVDIRLAEKPIIYSVVYDDKKAKMLEATGTEGFNNYKDEPYQIRFVGSLGSQYSYGELRKVIELEKNAIQYHFEWVRFEEFLRETYNDGKDKDTDTDEIRAFRRFYIENGGRNYWYSGDYHFPKLDKEGKVMMDENDDPVPDFDSPINPEAIKNAIEGFFNFEYFRHSSMAKALHKKVITSKPENHFAFCTCNDCENARISEHMRWNAYMRSIGYIYGERCDRGKVHNDLVLWDDLEFAERFKD